MSKIVIASFVLLFISTGILTAQCQIEIISPKVDTVYICIGDTVYLNSQGHCDDFFLNEDFNDKEIGRGWKKTSSADFSNPCGPPYDSPNHTYFWVGPTAVDGRYLETEEFHIPKNAGAEVVFYIKYPKHTSKAYDSPCEGPDEPDEGVGFEYNINGVWDRLDYYTPSETENLILYNWKKCTIPLEDDICTPQTKFRWKQNRVSSPEFDHWGIDDISISANLPPGQVEWSHGPKEFSGGYVIPTKTTDYIVKIDNSYTSDSDTVTVIVHPRPLKNNILSYSICLGESVQIGGPGGNDISSFDILWYPERGLDNPNKLQPSASPKATTVYQRKLSNLGGCFAIDTIKVIVAPEITCDLIDNIDQCDLDTLTISPKISGGIKPFKYLWEPNEFIIGSQFNKELRISPTESMKYFLTISDSAGCTFIDSVLINVNESPKVDINQHVRVCAGADTVIGGEAYGSMPPFEYKWTPIEGLDSPNSAATRVEIVETTTYMLEIKSANGCITRKQVIVEVQPIPNANTGPDALICYGDSIQIGEDSFCGVAPYTYSWEPSESIVESNEGYARLSFFEATKIIQKVTDQNNCIAIDTIKVDVNPEIQVETSIPGTICFGRSFEITTTVTGGTPPYEYQWYPVNSIMDPFSDKALVYQNFSDEIGLVVMDNKGCSSEVKYIYPNYYYTQASVSAPIITSAPYEKNIYIPIMLDNSSTVLDCTPDSVYIELSLDARFYNPLGVTYERWINHSMDTCGN